MFIIEGATPGRESYTPAADDSLLAPAGTAPKPVNNSQKPIWFLFFYPGAGTQREVIPE